MAACNFNFLRMVKDPGQYEELHLRCGCNGDWSPGNCFVQARAPVGGQDWDHANGAKDKLPETGWHSLYLLSVAVYYLWRASVITRNSLHYIYDDDTTVNWWTSTKSNIALLTEFVFFLLYQRLLTCEQYAISLNLLGIRFDTGAVQYHRRYLSQCIVLIFFLI
jgi:hypothetical protein